MNKTFQIIPILLLIVFAACAPKEPPVKPPAKPDKELFADAENRYQENDYSKAYELYRKYVEQYPDTAQAPKAYLRLGMIRGKWSDFGKARRMYGKVIDRYPDTRYAGQARVKTLESYVEQGRFREAIAYWTQLPVEELEVSLRVQANLLAGDSHMALEQFRRAYEAFSAAYQEAGRQKRSEMADRLLAAVSALEPEFIDSELKRLGAKPPAGFLMYQHGVNLIADRRIGDTLSVFKRFQEHFPDHPIADRVKEQMVSLTSEAFFEGNTIGCVLPLSGKYESFGRQALRGIELALGEASVEIDEDPPFKVLVRDSASEPEKADRAVKELAGKRVAAVIGPIAAASKAADTAQRLGIPLIALSQKTEIVETGEYVFRNFLTPEMQVSALADYTTDKLGCRNFAVLYPDEHYGRTFLHLFWDRLLEKNARVMGAESYNPEHTDFADPIKKLVGLYYQLPEALKTDSLDPGQLKALAGALEVYEGLLLEDLYSRLKEPESEPLDFLSGNPRIPEEKPEPRVDFEALFIPDSPEKAGLIIPQLRYYDIKNVYLLGTNLWHSQKLIDIAGDQIREAVIPEGFFAESSRKQVRDFVDKFEKVYGYKPGFIEAVGYDTAMILCTRIADQNVFTRPALRQALVQMPPYRGVTGETEFLDNGEADKSVYLLKISGKNFVEINR